jgi:putative flippase GtrA
LTAGSPGRGNKRFWVLVRSSLIGLVATLTDLGSLFVLVHGLGLTPAQANVLSLLPGLLVQFFGNKYFAFGDRSRALLRQGGLFALVEFGAFLLNVLVFHLIVTLSALHYILARVLGTALVYLGFSFPLWGLIFRTRAAEDLDRPAAGAPQEGR